jgi:flagellar biosynthesis/type III secretory pathway M-ring protein FliF/YscJ
VVASVTTTFFGILALVIVYILMRKIKRKNLLIKAVEEGKSEKELKKIEMEEENIFTKKKENLEYEEKERKEILKEL